MSAFSLDACKTCQSAPPNFAVVAERGADALNPVLFYLAVVYGTMVAVTSRWFVDKQNGGAAA
jgi:hypothetical protein